MRTNIVIDDELMAEAMQLSGCKTKKETVEEGLKQLVRYKLRQSMLSLRGKIDWEGDLDEMRSHE